MQTRKDATVFDSAEPYCPEPPEPPYDRDSDPTYDPDAHGDPQEWYPEWDGPDADASAYTLAFARADGTLTVVAHVTRESLV